MMQLLRFTVPGFKVQQLVTVHGLQLSVHGWEKL